MKKFLIYLLILLTLSSCTVFDKKEEINQVYLDLLQLVRDNDKFKNNSDIVSINLSVSKIADEYRYDIFIDEPLIAMYRVKAIAIFEGVDHQEAMALNFGVFDNKSYNLIPNQSYVEKGYIKGFIMSGVNPKKVSKIQILLQWQNFDNSETFKEFITIKGEKSE